ncbi:hypothetical protein [Rhodopseudomonas sp. RCAM05734]|uniref:hypothetical protein n=1 Tax=Rhodopseudomonas sp. RCAM05734 TaxID=3457549 RepID=UPI004044B493
MSPDDALRMTRSLVNENGQAVAIRRYSGTGPARSYVDTATTAFVRNYGSKELVGAIVQGDQVAVVLVDTLAAILPVTTNEFLVVNSKEFAIKNPMKRVVGGVLIALEIHAKG